MGHMYNDCSISHWDFYTNDLFAVEKTGTNIYSTCNFVIHSNKCDRYDSIHSGQVATNGTFITGTKKEKFRSYELFTI